MAKYRLIKETRLLGKYTFYYIKKKVWFWWVYVEGTNCLDEITARDMLNKLVTQPNIKREIIDEL